MTTTIGQMYILSGSETAAKALLNQLAADVHANEPDTLLYLIHMPDASGVSMPPASAGEVTFVEVYKDEAAFKAHLSGPAFTTFVAKSKGLFLMTENKAPDGTTVTGLFATFAAVDRLAGFSRS